MKCEFTNNNDVVIFDEHCAYFLLSVARVKEKRVCARYYVTDFDRKRRNESFDADGKYMVDVNVLAFLFMCVNPSG